MQDFKVFIGWDSREDIAYQVAKHSIQKENPNIEVVPLKLHELREQGFYTRADDKKGSTEFTITRFLPPALMNYKGYSLFMDCDMLVQADLVNILGVAYLESNEIEKSIDLFNEAKVIDAKNSASYLNLSNAYKKKGMDKESQIAFDEYKKIIK